MNLFLRAGLRSGRSLVVSAIVAAISTIGVGLLTIRLGLIDSNTDDHAIFILIQVIAAVLAHALVFIAIFSAATFVAIRRDRAAQAAEDQASIIVLAKDKKIIGVLQKLLGDRFIGVSQCYLFGSVVHRHPTRDVDAAIQFSSSKPRSVQRYRKRLYTAERQFETLCEGLPLNLTLFLSSEEDALHEFLQCAGQDKRII